MLEQTVMIVNPTGLHARPAKLLCSAAQKFKCKILLIMDTKVIDVKSILNIMAGGISKGSTVLIRCEGEDEDKALPAIVNLLENMKE